MAQQTTDNEKNIEDVFQELDVIAEKLESSDTSLEDSFRLYKKGNGASEILQRQTRHSREKDAPDG